MNLLKQNLLYTLNGMSRSYKKSKVYNLFAGSDKEDKIKAHKKFRRTSKIKLKLNQDLPTKLEEIEDV